MCGRILVCGQSYSRYVDFECVGGSSSVVRVTAGTWNWVWEDSLVWLEFQQVHDVILGVKGSSSVVRVTAGTWNWVWGDSRV